ncbi:MAG: hypothetical protein ABSB76_39940 [Streptosporangiaceae bacterium]
MDRPEVRQSVAASPDAMLEGLRPPVILDEWQEVPELLGAVKRSVDEDPAPGRSPAPRWPTQRQRAHPNPLPSRRRKSGHGRRKTVSTSPPAAAFAPRSGISTAPRIP